MRPTLFNLNIYNTLIQPFKVNTVHIIICKYYNFQKLLDCLNFYVKQ